MSNEALTIKLGLTGQQQTVRGIDQVTQAEKRMGAQAKETGASVKVMGATTTAFGSAASQAGRMASGAFAASARGAKYAGAGIAALALAGAKWGLQTNAQIEQARLRFSLFTSDVDGLTQSVRVLDKNSAFAFSDLAEAAATLGGSGIKDVPTVLQAVANAAAAGGKGTQGLQAITLALSQIQSKGRLSQEEVNQLTEGGALTAQRDLATGLGLTTKQLQNLGGAGIEANKAIDVLTRAWTSGKMADIAKKQTQTLGGQFNLLTGNAQTAAAAATQSLANGLRDDVLPAANEALTEITKLFGDEGLSNQDKLRRARKIVDRELGPIADDLLEKLDEADIPGHLGAALRAAAPKMAAAAGEVAPEVAKAFVDAWLASGPWLQLGSALLIWKKLGAPGLPGGKGGGGLGGAAGKGSPIPVWVVNNGPVPGGVTDKTPRVARAAKQVGRYAGPLAATVIGAELIQPLLSNQNLPTRGAGASSPSNPAGHVPFAPGGLQRAADPVVISTSIALDDRVVAKAVHQAELRRQGRGG